MYYITVKPQNQTFGKNYVFKSIMPLNNGRIVKCETRYGDMYGVVTGCLFSNEDEGTVVSFLKMLDPNITTPLKKVMYLYNEIPVPWGEENGFGSTGK